MMYLSLRITLYTLNLYSFCFDTVSVSYSQFFVLLTVPFTLQKLFSLMQSCLLVFALFPLPEETSKNFAKMSESILPRFSCRSFMVSGLIFKSLIHFECISLWCEKLVQFDCFEYSGPTCPAPFIEETAFPPLYSLAFSVIDWPPR